MPAPTRTTREETPDEEPEEKAAKSPPGLVSSLEAIVEKYERQTEPFDQETLTATAPLVKRLSRTLGMYREPEPTEPTG
jgi:hypothetical protein